MTTNINSLYTINQCHYTLTLWSFEDSWQQRDMFLGATCEVTTDREDLAWHGHIDAFTAGHARRQELHRLDNIQRSSHTIHSEFHFHGITTAIINSNVKSNFRPAPLYNKNPSTNQRHSAWLTTSWTCVHRPNLAKTAQVKASVGTHKRYSIICCKCHCSQQSYGLYSSGLPVHSMDLDLSTWPIPYSQLLEYQADNAYGHRQPLLRVYLRHG